MRQHDSAWQAPRYAAALKRAATDAVNHRFMSIRGRRAGLAADPGFLRTVLTTRNERVSEIAARTLAEVRELMHTSY
jgi:tryptophanyl-tRNA synthetase